MVHTDRKGGTIMRMLRMRTVAGMWLVALSATTSLACQEPRDSIDVLYVGNSYIYFNNLPEMVEGISMGLEGPVLRGASVTNGGATLQQHVDSDRFPSTLTEGAPGGETWDWVFMQEQSTLGGRMDRETGALESPDDFHSAARKMVEMIQAEGARPALYMTWAKEPFPAQTETLSNAYRSIGQELGIPVAAVGEAWGEVDRVRPELNLHIADGSHPSPAGSYLTACVIYATVTGHSPVGAPREITGAPWDFAGEVDSSQPTVLVSLSEADAEFLQTVAWEVVVRGGPGGG